jgi:hypothetical protein
MKPIKLKFNKDDLSYLLGLIKYITQKHNPFELFSFELIVMNEILLIINNCKDSESNIIKIKLCYSQSFISYNSFARIYNQSPSIDAVIYRFNSQIEKQLYKESYLGFELLKNKHNAS